LLGAIGWKRRARMKGRQRRTEWVGELGNLPEELGNSSRELANSLRELGNSLSDVGKSMRELPNLPEELANSFIPTTEANLFRSALGSDHC